jgi:predicted ribosomally synthesized peptide with nif11-like leader
MSVAACTEFLRKTYETPELRQQLKAITATPELIALGRAHGYDFEVEELAEASLGLTDLAETQDADPETPARPRVAQDAYHYEYDVAAVDALAGLASELPNLTIQPSSVDLAAFAARFNADDLRLLDRTPHNDPDIKQLYAGDGHGPAAPRALRRDFHLINLDEHADHPEYPDYFAAKGRAIAALEEAFGTEIKMSGSMWYPPGAYRMWHTNESQPGWRMYVVVPSDEPVEPHELSYFRYRNPQTGELVTLPEPGPVVRVFRAEHEPHRLFWHCIGNPGPRHRWSFGFVVPDDWMDRLGVTPETGK